MTEKHPIVLPLKWHPKSEDQAHNGSVYFEPIKGHAYAVAMQPRYVSDADWKAYAEQLTRSVNALPELVAALEFYRDAFEFHPKRSVTGVDQSEWKPRAELIDDCGNRALAALSKVKG